MCSQTGFCWSVLKVIVAPKYDRNVHVSFSYPYNSVQAQRIEPGWSLKGLLYACFAGSVWEPVACSGGGFNYVYNTFISLVGEDGQVGLVSL